MKLNSNDTILSYSLNYEKYFFFLKLRICKFRRNCLTVLVLSGFIPALYGQNLIFSYSSSFPPEFRISPFENINTNGTQKLKYSIQYSDLFNSASEGSINRVDSFYFTNSNMSFLISPALTNIYGVKHNFAAKRSTYPNIQSNYYNVSYLNAFNFPDSTFYIHYDSTTNQIDTTDYLFYTYDSNAKSVIEYAKVYFNSQWNDVHLTSFIYDGVHLSYLYQISYDSNTNIYDTTFVFHFKHDSLNRLLEDGLYDKHLVPIQRYLVHYASNLIDSVKIEVDLPFNEQCYYKFDWNYPYFERTNYKFSPPVFPFFPGGLSELDKYRGKVNSNGFIDSITYYNWTAPTTKEYTIVNKYDLNNYLTDSYRIVFDSNGNANMYSDSIIYRYEYKYPQNVSNKNKSELVVKLSPIPSSSNLFVQYEIEEAKKMEYQIYSLNGQLVEHGFFQSHKGNNVNVVNIENYPIGLYLMKIESFVGKFFKQN